MAPQMLTGENEIAMVRQHWIAIVPPLVVGLLIVIASVVLLALVPGTIAGHDVGTIKRVVALAILILVVLVVLVRVLRWRYSTYTLTNRRIVVSMGVISRVTESISLDRIQDTVMRRPLADRLIRAGDVEIESAGREGVEVLHRIPHADSFYNQILQAIELHRTGMPFPVASMGGGLEPPPPPPPPPPGYPHGGV